MQQQKEKSESFWLPDFCYLVFFFNIYRYLSNIYNAVSVNIPPATNAAMYPILFIIF